MGAEKDRGRPVGVIRLPDWRPALDAVIETGNRAAWEWGRHDCLAFAAQAVEAVIGADLFEPYRGRYHDEAGAKALVPDVERFVRELAAAQGWPEIEPNQALDGDLGLFAWGKTPVVGVIYGRLVFPKSPGGLRTMSRSTATTVWALGHG